MTNSLSTALELKMNNGRSSDRAGQSLEMSRDIKTALKQVLLLTVALFLMTAPTPDSKDIAAITTNFIAPLNDLGVPGLKARE